MAHLGFPASDACSKICMRFSVVVIEVSAKQTSPRDFMKMLVLILQARVGLPLCIEKSQLTMFPLVQGPQFKSGGSFVRNNVL